MILNENSRTTALVGGICMLRNSCRNYDEVFATIVYRNGNIEEIIKLNENIDIEQHIRELKSKYNRLLCICLYNPDNPCYIFPGLIDIHNHIDYNMMPIWQRPYDTPWDNRHEWRNSAEYSADIKKLYSFIFENWNKYSEAGKNEDAYTVIQFFSELQAIAGGTTTLQESDEIYYTTAEKKEECRAAKHILLRSTGIAEDIGLSAKSGVNSIIDFFRPKHYEDLKTYHKFDNNWHMPKEYYKPSIDTYKWEIKKVIKSQAAGLSYFDEYLNFLKTKTVDEISRTTQ